MAESDGTDGAGLPDATGGGQETGGEGGQQQAGQQPSGGGWLDNLNPDTRAALAPKNFGSPQDLAKAYLELEPKIAAKGVLLPGEKASEEERNAFFNALGRPENVDDYDLGDFKPPEGLPWNGEAQKAALGEFHNLGLTNAQAEGVLKHYSKYVADAWEAQQAEEANEAAKSETALRGELGQAFDAKMDLGNRVVAEFGGKELVEELEKTGLGRRANLVRAFIAIGEQFAEDGKLPGGQVTNFAKTPQEAKAEISRLKADPEFQKAFTDRKHPEHQDAVKRLTALNEMARGDR